MKYERNLKGLFIYLLISVVAILTLYPVQLAAIETQLERLNQSIPLPIEIVTLLSLINPLILVVIALIVGYFVADKVQLHSIGMHKVNDKSFNWGQLRNGMKPALIGGLLLGIIIVLFDIVFRPLLPDALIGTIEKPNLLSIIPALLYGGIVEELLLRFGLMSLIVFIIWKLFQRKREKPSNTIYIVAIIISAFLFALGHYGVTSAITKMTAFVWIRMLVLNGLGGVVFGWLYWKYKLETAMIAHMMSHISMNIVVLILSFFV